MKKSITLILIALVVTAASMASAKDDPLAAWKPKFDPSGAEFTYLGEDEWTYLRGFPATCSAWWGKRRYQ